MGWLEQAQAAIAEAVGDDVSAYALTEAEIADLLELARIAAHESGERTNAPLTTYLAGLARARHPERGLKDVIEAVGGQST